VLRLVAIRILGEPDPHGAPRQRVLAFGRLLCCFSVGNLDDLCRIGPVGWVGRERDGTGWDGMPTVIGS
jgi:hypothetical protein